MRIVTEDRLDPYYNIGDIQLSFLEAVHDLQELLKSSFVIHQSQSVLDILHVFDGFLQLHIWT